jgi:pyruvate-formate lyase
MMNGTPKSEPAQVDKAILDQIDAIEFSPRLKKEREEFFKREVEITADRAVLAMEWWKETDEDVLDIRWAKLVKKLAERLPIVIFNGQLVVGNGTKLFRGADPWVEIEPRNVLATMEKGSRGIRQSAARLLKCTEEDWAALEEAVGFFLGKSPVDAIFKVEEDLYGNWPEEMEKARGMMRTGRYHMPSPVPMWDKLLKEGARAIIREAEAGIEKVRSGREPDARKAWFWRAVIICCEAVIYYAHRYAKFARELAQDETDPARRKELEQIAEACARVPEYPARTLQEAIQSRLLWGIAVMWCRPNLVSDENGRVDQYLYPYFISDVRENRLSIESASDLIGTLVSNQARRDGFRSKERGQYSQGTLVSNVALGGVTQDGRDANNELTYLILHMAGLQKYAEPHYTFRVDASTPRWILLKALDTNRKVGGGQPQFMSDDRVISYFVRGGEALEDARDWVGHG